MRFLSIAATLTALCLSAGRSSAAEDTDLRVMTFNIRYDNPRDGVNAWPHRRDWVAEIVESKGADIVGMQEVVRGQALDLEKRLPGFAWHGVGRDDGKQAGEYVPIFYRRDRFELLDKSAFWLSETPEKAGSKSWDAALPRVTTWLKLKDKRTGRELFVFNTHFDHMGVAARENSAALLRRKIAEIAGATPAVLTGDFNCVPSAKPYLVLTETATGDVSATLLADALVKSAERHGPDSTWNGFQQIIPQRRIDFVFVSPAWEVLSHHIYDDQREGRFPSDHLPAMATLRLAP